MKIRRIAAAVLAVTSLVGGLTACGNSSSADSGTTVKVGVVGDSNEVWDQVVIPNLKKEGINVELVKFSDYIQPNEALAKGDIDLNAYQATSSWTTSTRRMTTRSPQSARRCSTRSACTPTRPRRSKTFRKLRSHHRQRLRQRGPRPAAAPVRRPDQARLQGRYEPHAGRHRVQPEEPEDHRAGSLADRPFAARRRSQRHQRVHALDAGLNPKSDAIYIEPVNEQSKPYYNIIVSRAKDKDNATYKKIVDAYRSDDVKKLIDKLYKGAVIPLW